MYYISRRIIHIFRWLLHDVSVYFFNNLQVSRKEKLLNLVASDIVDNINLNDTVGIVGFNTKSTIVASLMKITHMGMRRTLSGKLSKTLDYGTCIGCGLLAGIAVINYCFDTIITVTASTTHVFPKMR